MGRIRFAEYIILALRAGEELARAAGENESAAEYRRLFESGKSWFDSRAFNGEYYVQTIEGRPADAIAKGLRSGMGADDPQHPQYQLGNGCLVDQLVGQYLAEVAGLGSLLDPVHIQKTLASIVKYNHKSHLFDHDTVQRTFALNDEAALVICDYGRGERPKIPFPYYAEVMTGFEYSAAVLMLYAGMVDRGQVYQRYSAAVRRHTTQSMGRSRMRTSLRARYGIVVRSACSQQFPVPRCWPACQRFAPSETFQFSFLLVGWYRLGYVCAHRAAGENASNVIGDRGIATNPSGRDGR